MTVGSRAKPSIPPVEPGSYLARCVGVVDLGEQEVEYKGKTRYSDKVKLIFELPTERITIDGENLPRQLSRNFTFSVSKKGSLRQFISAWLSRSFTDGEFSEFDLFSLLRHPALLSVVHSEDGQYANIAGAMAVPRGMDVPTAQSDLIRFDTQEWDDSAFDALPEYLQDQLKRSTQYRNMHLPDQEVSVEAAAAEAAETASAEEVPF